MVASIGKALASGLTRSLGKKTGAAVVNNKQAAVKVAKAKSLENVRQGSIIEAQKVKEKLSKQQGFKTALKEAKAKKQKSFTYDGVRFMVSDY